MKLNEMFTDEKAMSPVIGVVLMVAITVVLAGTVGIMMTQFTESQTFDDGDVTMPSAGFSDNATSSTGVSAPIGLELDSVRNGPLNAGNVYISVEGSTSIASGSNGTWADLASVGASQSLDLGDTLFLHTSDLESSGDWADVDRIVIKWQDDSGSQSNTLETFDLSMIN